MKRWYITFIDNDGKAGREIIEAVSVLGAASRFTEMHAELTSKSITAVILADLEGMEGLGLPTSNPDRKKRT